MSGDRSKTHPLKFARECVERARSATSRMPYQDALVALAAEIERLTRAVEERAEKLDCALAREIDLRAALGRISQDEFQPGEWPHSDWQSSYWGVVNIAREALKTGGSTSENEP